MAKAQAAARFMTEVAPPQFVAIMRRRKVPRSLDTIAEDDRELAYSDHCSKQANAAAAASVSAITAASLKRASPAGPRTGGFMRELGSCFSNNVHGQAAAGWESTSHKGHGRRVGAAYAHRPVAWKSYLN